MNNDTSLGQPRPIRIKAKTAKFATFASKMANHNKKSESENGHLFTYSDYGFENQKEMSGSHELLAKKSITKMGNHLIPQTKIQIISD